MKNFRLIEQNVPLAEIAAELEQNEPAWLISTARQRLISVQRETESIFLRSAVKVEEGKSINDVHESTPAKAAKFFPRTLDALSALSARLEGELSRALFARLKPGGQVYRHIDHGAYYACRDRFHLVIRSNGSDMRCGDEDVKMHTGELWWFDNKVPHEAFNRSEQPRVHLIFDLLRTPR